METKKDNLKKVKDNQADEPPLSETESKNASDDALPSETAEKSKEKAKSEKPKKKKHIHLRPTNTVLEPEAWRSNLQLRHSLDAFIQKG